jgi:hypothetical protein
MNLAPAASGPAFDARPREYPLWHYIWKLLRLRATITVNGVLRARLRRKIGVGILAVVILFVIVFVFVLSWLLLGALQSPALAEILAEQNIGSVTPFLESIPVLILASVFLVLLLTGFGVLLRRFTWRGIWISSSARRCPFAPSS